MLAVVSQAVSSVGRVPLRQYERIISLLEGPVLTLQSIILLLQCFDAAFQRFDSCLALVCVVLASERPTATLPAWPILVALIMVSPHRDTANRACFTYPHLAIPTRVAGDSRDGAPLRNLVAAQIAVCRLTRFSGLAPWRHRASRVSDIDAAEYRQRACSQAQPLCRPGIIMRKEATIGPGEKHQHKVSSLRGVRMTLYNGLNKYWAAH